MRLSGLAAGIATFAVLEITHNLLREWTKIGPGRDDALARPGDHRPDAGGDRHRRRDRGRLRVPAQPLGRSLRATREDAAAAQAAGIDVHRQRLWAFTLSGALAGLAGGLYVHMLGSITADQVYLELTFVTLAMLVIGGVTSLWGAVVGALAVSGLDSFLSEAEQGVGVGFDDRPARRARGWSSSGR